MSQDFVNNPLWAVLVEAVKTLPLYKNHKAYTRDKILLDSPNLTHEELAVRLTIPLGEALVIMSELLNEKEKTLNND